MTYPDYETLINWCNVKLDSNKYVHFIPKIWANEQIINDIIKNNNLEHLSLTDFQKITSAHRPAYMAAQESRQKQFDAYSKLSAQEIAALPITDKLQYIDTMLGPLDTKSKIIDTCKQNDDKIRACVFSLTFPRNFWIQEKNLANRYTALIAKSPDIMDSIKNWSNTSLDIKKQTVLKAAEIFKYVYGTVPEIEFFTPDKIASTQGHIWAAYYDRNDHKIHFNTDRLQSADNFFAVSVMLHEGTHFRQHTQRFKDPLNTKMFSNPISKLKVYDTSVSDKTKSHDFYTMIPAEQHAYGLQEHMENYLTELTGITKHQTEKLDTNTQSIHNAAFTIAKINQYKSGSKT